MQNPRSKCHELKNDTQAWFEMNLGLNLDHKTIKTWTQ